MEIKELQNIYATHPNLKALSAKLEDSSVNTLFLAGLHASSATAFFSSYLKNASQTIVFVLNDLEEAGYFYHDLTQINGEENVLFFPSSYRRAIKYGQKDPANEILRTEVLSRLQKGERLCIVTSPEAIAEKMEKLIRKNVPEYLHSEWSFANELASLPVFDALVEALIERGLLTPPENRLGAEGCWMSVEK